MASKFVILWDARIVQYMVLHRSFYMIIYLDLYLNNTPIVHVSSSGEQPENFGRGFEFGSGIPKKYLRYSPTE